MAEPTVKCPQCLTEIPLTESLAAPMIEALRQDYEKKILRTKEDIAQRELAIKNKESALEAAKEAVEQRVEEKVKLERTRIAAEEAKKARAALAADLEKRATELAEARDLVKAQEGKLAEAETARLENEKKLLKQKEEIAQREMGMKARELALAAEQEAIDQMVADKVKIERATIAAEECKKAKAALATDFEQKVSELAELQEVLKLRNEKLAEAQLAQADLMRKQRELDDARREMEVTIEKRIGESLAKTREQAKQEAEEHLQLKVMEREKTIDSMKKTIEELQKKAEQGSQQLQGEVLELQLETLLGAKFPHDRIDPVPKGEHGGDILHRVVTPTGVGCGTILWETKRTKNWGGGWLAKLREDQRSAKAEIAVIVSTVLPIGVETFDQVEGVWVVHPRAMLPVALSLRQMLIEVNSARQATEGQQTKMELVYQYLTGPKFRLRVQAIVEAFGEMADDLAKEKRAITKQWAKRAEQIDRVMQATVGMYGELQGIAGKTLQEIAGLDIKMLETDLISADA